MLVMTSFISGRDSQENLTELVVFARMNVKESELIGSEENRTKLFLETAKAVATP